MAARKAQDCGQGAVGRAGFDCRVSNSGITGPGSKRIANREPVLRAGARGLGASERRHHRDTMYLREVEAMATTMVHVRVDEKTKQKAAKTLAGMGISVSDAVRMLLVRVAAEKALPFEVRLPNATTVKAMRAADKGKGRRHRSADALFKELGI
jgi:DNA-damage-inducible protein J